MAIKDYTARQAPEYTPVRSGTTRAAPVRIKVIGVGDGGCNCVKRMMHHAVPGMTFAMVNTDDKTLDTEVSQADVILINKHEVRGWDAFGEYRAGDGGFEESSAQLRKVLAGSDLVFVTAGMGGGAGTGAATYVAHLAREIGALVVGLVPFPFRFERRRRMGLAVSGVDRLRPHVDNLILVHNDRLLTYINLEAPMLRAFHAADDAVPQRILSVSELINVPHEINIDLAGIRSIMGNRGGSLMAIGRGNRDAGPLEAARQTVANPLSDLRLGQAQCVLILVTGGVPGMTLAGVNSACQLVADAVPKHAGITVGMGVDESMGEKVNLTLIATGIQDESIKPDQGADQTQNPSAHAGSGPPAGRQPPAFSRTGTALTAQPPTRDAALITVSTSRT